MSKTRTIIISILSAIIIFLGGNYAINNLGSVSVGSGYYATTTPENSQFSNNVIKYGQGTLGSIIITTAGNVAFDLLNATTTNVNLRTGNKATSTILMATVPASLAAGTYTFDAIFNNLYIDVKSGTLGSSTITFR